MSILNRITHHHDDEKSAVEDALETQKLRVSCERRIHNFEKLIQEEVPEIHQKHVVLGKMHNLRLEVEKMLNEMDDPSEGK